MQVESLARDVGREQDTRAAAGEHAFGVAAVGAREAPVQHGDRTVSGERTGCRVERVAIFGEHDGWFVRPPQQRRNPRQLALRGGRQLGGVAQCGKDLQLASTLVEARLT